MLVGMLETLQYPLQLRATLDPTHQACQTGGPIACLMWPAVTY